MGNDKKLAELFNEYTLQDGGKLQVNELDKDDQKSLNNISLSFQWCRKMNIYVDFIDNPNANAVAFLYEGRKFIGINIGTIWRLSTFSIAVANFVDLFNTESIINNDLRLEVKRKLRDGTLKDSSLTKKQLALRNALFSMGLNFIIFHEFSHFNSGHLDYIQQNANKTKVALYEVDPGHKDNVTSLTYSTRTALEIDADIDAVELLINNIENTGNLLSPYTEIFSNSIKMYMIIELAISTTFFQFDKIGNSIQEQSGYHPHPLIRQEIVRNAFLSYFSVYKKKNFFNEVKNWFHSKTYRDLHFEIYYLDAGPRCFRIFESIEQDFFQKKVAKLWEDSRPTWDALARITNK